MHFSVQFTFFWMFLWDSVSICPSDAYAYGPMDSVCLVDMMIDSC